MEKAHLSKSRLSPTRWLSSGRAEAGDWTAACTRGTRPGTAHAGQGPEKSPLSARLPGLWRKPPEWAGHREWHLGQGSGGGCGQAESASPGTESRPGTAQVTYSFQDRSGEQKDPQGG